MATPAMTYAVFVPVVLLVLYRRLRRHVGRQPLQGWRLGLVGYFLRYAVGLWRVARSPAGEAALP